MAEASARVLPQLPPKTCLIDNVSAPRHELNIDGKMPMIGKSRSGQMAGPDERRVRRPVCARIVLAQQSG
jgi:hypothetical protein